jgi:lysophospholipase L1-like esterase
MQRRMAQELHVGFFNLYEAMGGDGSMAKLVDRGEANKDYTHLNVKGGKRLADLYYQSILAGVENHRRRMAAKGGEE